MKHVQFRSTPYFVSTPLTIRTILCSRWRSRYFDLFYLPEVPRFFTHYSPFVSLCRHCNSNACSSTCCPLHGYTIRITSIQVAFHCGHRSCCLFALLLRGSVGSCTIRPTTFTQFVEFHVVTLLTHLLPKSNIPINYIYFADFQTT